MGTEILKDELYVEVMDKEKLEEEKVANEGRCVFMEIDEFQPIPVQKSNGPSSLNQTHQFIKKLNRSVKSSKNKRKAHKIVVNHVGEVDSALFLVAAYLMIMRSMTMEKVEKHVNLDKTKFCDSTGKFLLSLRDYVYGLMKAVKYYWYNPFSYDICEGKYYEEWSNGNISEVIPSKLYLMPTPKGVSESYCHPDTYIDYFIRKNITTVVKLTQEQCYDKLSFEDEGIEVVDLGYEDGGDPPSHVIRRFLELMSEEGRSIAIHCKAGLGRAGTLAAIYMVRYMGMTASEAISYLRIVRPGCVLGLQAIFVQFAEKLTKSKDRDNWEKLDGILDDAVESEGNAPWKCEKLSQADWLNKSKVNNHKQLERSRVASPVGHSQDIKVSLGSLDHSKTSNRIKKTLVDGENRQNRKDQPSKNVYSRDHSPEPVQCTAQQILKAADEKEFNRHSGYIPGNVKHSVEEQFNRSQRTSPKSEDKACFKIAPSEIANRKEDMKWQAPANPLNQELERKPACSPSRNEWEVRHAQFDSVDVDRIDERAYRQPAQRKDSFVKMGGEKTTEKYQPACSLKMRRNERKLDDLQCQPDDTDIVAPFQDIMSNANNQAYKPEITPLFPAHSNPTRIIKTDSCDKHVCGTCGLMQRPKDKKPLRKNNRSSSRVQNCKVHCNMCHLPHQPQSTNVQSSKMRKVSSYHQYPVASVDLESQNCQQHNEFLPRKVQSEIPYQPEQTLSNSIFLQEQYQPPCFQKRGQTREKFLAESGDMFSQYCQPSDGAQYYQPPEETRGYTGFSDYQIPDLTDNGWCY